MPAPDLLETYNRTNLKELDEFPHGIPTWERYSEWCTVMGINDRFHGTWHDKGKKLFTYIKPSWEVDNFRMGLNAISVFYFLREKGLFHPSCEFRLITNKEQKLQVIAMMKGVEPWDSAKNGKDGRQLIKMNIGESNLYQGQLEEDSHILEWLRRLDQKIDKDNLENHPLYPILMNVHTEGSYSHNWGWDPTTGKAYPTDMEIFALSDEYSDEKNEYIKQAINSWSYKTKS